MGLSIIKTQLNKPQVRIGLFIFLLVLLSFGTGYLIGRDWTPAPIIVDIDNNK
jgi:hypothetical protein